MLVLYLVSFLSAGVSGAWFTADKMKKNFNDINRHLSHLQNTADVLTNLNGELGQKLRNQTIKYDLLTYRFNTLQQKLGQMEKAQLQVKEDGALLEVSVEKTNHQVQEVKTDLLMQINNNQNALVRRIEEMERENIVARQATKQLDEKLEAEVTKNKRLSVQLQDLKRVIRNVNNNMSTTINEMQIKSHGIVTYMHDKATEAAKLHGVVHKLQQDIRNIESQIYNINTKANERYTGNYDDDDLQEASGDDGMGSTSEEMMSGYEKQRETTTTTTMTSTTQTPSTITTETFEEVANGSPDDMYMDGETIKINADADDDDDANLLHSHQETRN